MSHLLTKTYFEWWVPASFWLAIYSQKTAIAIKFFLKMLKSSIFGGFQ